MVHRVKGIVSRSSAVALFDIRVGTNEKDVIIIAPSDMEAAPTLVQGRVVLSLSDSLSVRSITLRMYGVATVAWFDSTAFSKTPPTKASQKQTKTVFEKEWSFLPETQNTFTLNQGNYEYPFEVLLPDDIPVSIEGLPGGAIIYKMKAIVERAGLVSKNFICKKHIRIVRTISPTSFEFLQSQFIENVWPNKCQYNIEIPTTAHIIGSQIPYVIRMTPHAKGLSVCRLDVELKEYYTFSVLDSKNALVAEKKMERRINSLTSRQRPADGDEWDLHGHIEIPNSLERCTQDCDVNFIKVRHRVKFVIALRNFDGHVSEIRASLPVTFVLPPHISSTGTTPHLDDSTINHISHLDNIDTLPTYESRIYDRLWDGVSYRELDTSVLNTPANMSRQISSENLRELNRDSMPSPVEIEAGLRQAMIQQNDEDLRSGNSSRVQSSESLNVLTPESGMITPMHSAPLMQAQDSQQSTPIAITIAQGDDDEEQPRLSPTPSLEVQHISRIRSDSSSSSVSLPLPNGYLDVSRLSRVPSYRTANSSNVVNFDPSTHSLPIYSSLGANPEGPRSRSRSRPRASLIESTSQNSTGRFLRPPSPACGTSSGDTDTGFQNVAQIGNVYITNC